jgi:hypothetical protein
MREAPITDHRVVELAEQHCVPLISPIRRNGVIKRSERGQSNAMSRAWQMQRDPGEGLIRGALTAASFD